MRYWWKKYTRLPDALVNAVQGKIEDGHLFCGANAYRATKMEHVKDIMDEFRSGIIYEGIRVFFLKA